MKLRLDPRDEFMHPLEEAANFNESMYFNAFESGTPFGAFFRIGNRPNEGHAEVTCCLYLPDGRVGFMFQRPEIRSNDALDAGGMRFDVIAPFEKLRVRYEGSVLVLDDPLQMADPKKAFTSNPVVPVKLDLEYTGISPVYGGEAEAEAGGIMDRDQAHPFARGHYEQHVSAAGEVCIGSDSFHMQGLGLRDHSWGPRYWQAPWWYRWLNGCLSPELGFMVSIIAMRDGSRHVGGMILDGGRYDAIVEANLRNDWETHGGEIYHGAIRANVRTESDRRFELVGEAMSRIPLRNRRKGEDGALQVTRISETMMRYRIGEHVAYGIAEYLDQIVDGQPVGVAGEAAA